MQPPGKFFFFLTRFLRCRCFFQVRPTSWPWYVLCNWPLPWSAWSSVWAEEKTRWRQIHVQMNECIYNIYDTCVMDMLLKRYAGSISAVYEVPMIYKAYVRCILYTSIYYIYTHTYTKQSCFATSLKHKESKNIWFLNFRVLFSCVFLNFRIFEFYLTVLTK